MMNQGDQQNSFYGFPKSKKDDKSQWASARKQLENEGFFILEDVFEASEIELAIEKIHQVYDLQISEIGGLENLKAIKEENTIRLPFLYDEFFLQFFCHPLVLEVLKAVYCDQFILLTQAGLINEPNKKHVGAHWHKDLPYQHYAAKQPICINALVTLTDFTNETGATCFIRGSHQYVEVPNDIVMDENFVQINALKGSVVFFNSLLLHRMGQNQSNNSRYAINHMFGTPLFKQHVNFHKMSKGKYQDDPVLSKLLDYPYAVPDSVLSYRQNKLNSIQKDI